MQAVAFVHLSLHSGDGEKRHLLATRLAESCTMIEFIDMERPRPMIGTTGISMVMIEIARSKGEIC